MNPKFVRKELESTFLNLISDNTTLTNLKAQEKIGKALYLMDLQQLKVKKLERYKSGFILLSLFFFGFFILAGVYAIQEYKNLFNKKIEFYVHTTINRRVIIKRREEKLSPNIAKSKFLSNKIKKLNPKINSDKIANLIVNSAITAKVDPFLVGAIIYAESNFNTNAISSAKARGLMQLLHSTANYISTTGKISQDKLHEPERNIKLGIDYLRYLLKLFNYDLEKALMAYNWGPDHLNTALKNKRNIQKDVKKYAQGIISLKKQWIKEFDSISSSRST